MLNRNIMFFNYLLSNYTGFQDDQYLLRLEDSSQIRPSYYSALRSDTLFTNLIIELENKVLNKNMRKDTISIDYLLNIAVKYFSIMKINEMDNYIGKVCAGLNDITKTELVRNPFVEAFAFSSILKHYQSDEFSLYNEFVNALKELYTLNLGIKNSERLLRAQGAMYAIMKNNTILRKMLGIEYERHKMYLPFILIY